MLINFQAFLAAVPGNEADLTVRQTMRGKQSEHLMPKEVWVD